LPQANVTQNEIVVSIRAEGGKVLIEIQDTGSGMSPEELARAFEPFFTTKPRGVGSGIGLSICRSIVTDMARQDQLREPSWLWHHVLHRAAGARSDRGRDLAAACGAAGAAERPRAGH
jgi:phosphoglycerate-specific signal transduction histidine kinase